MEKNNPILPDAYRNRRIEVMDFVHDTCSTNKEFTPVDGYHYGSVIKYTSRAGLKGSKLQDLKKAQETLRRWIIEVEDQLSKQLNIDHPPEPVKDQVYYRGLARERSILPSEPCSSDFFYIDTDSTPEQILEFKKIEEILKNEKDSNDYNKPNGRFEELRDQIRRAEQLSNDSSNGTSGVINGGRNFHKLNTGGRTCC